ncbi:conserved hypothetical protein [Burkholderia multivorans CGD2]|uniref:Uncharacterized protein n=1 Tax=Burkholderia multivorans CGD2 TaxID=513052 RepID=B9BI63_9BURK|nr:conserved hypothetical protein [Burkholderia multivorans CGD2]
MQPAASESASCVPDPRRTLRVHTRAYRRVQHDHAGKRAWPHATVRSTLREPARPTARMSRKGGTDATP